MKGKTVVITGAGSGLGASMAGRFASEGYHVCLLGRTLSKLENTASFLHGDYSIYRVDVTSKEDVAAVMQEIIKNNGSIEYLVNNAGTGIFKIADELTENEVHRMIDTNLKGTIFCTQEVLGIMKKQDFGSIVNIVSASGKTAKETESVYSASKFGVRGFSEALALELKDFNIQLLSAYMGNMKTDLWGKDETENDFMEPDDIAEIIFDNLRPRKNTMVTDITILNQ